MLLKIFIEKFAVFLPNFSPPDVTQVFLEKLLCFTDRRHYVAPGLCRRRRIGVKSLSFAEFME